MTPADLAQAELVQQALDCTDATSWKTVAGILADEVERLRTVVERLEKVEAAARSLVHEENGSGVRVITNGKRHVDSGRFDALARELARPAGEDGGT